MRELTETPNIIIFIDELHTLVGAGSAEGSLDAANILKPALSRGEIQCIGATTPGGVPKAHREGPRARAALPGREGGLADRGGDGPDHPRGEGALREVPQRALPRRGDRGGRLPVEPLHHRPLPARQGDRPDRRGGQPREAARDAPCRSASRRSRDACGSSSSPTGPSAGPSSATRRVPPASRCTCSPSTGRSAATSRLEVTKADIDDVVSRWTGHPDHRPQGGGVGEAAPHGGGAPQADRLAGRGDRRRGAGHPPHARGPQEPEPAGGLVPVPRADGRRQDRGRARPRRVPLRLRAQPRPLRHVGVHGEALGQQADRLAPRLRRPRGGRPAHRAGEAQPLQRGAPRRDREGPPRHLQRAAAGVRGRAPHRRPRQHRRLQEHDHHHDLEHRGALHREEGPDGLRVERAPRDRRRRRTRW